MTTTQLKQELQKTHETLWASCSNLPIEVQNYQPNGKWSAVQHVQHIGKSIAALYKYFQLDKAVITNMFGVADHASRTYEEATAFFTQYVVGAVSTERFAPETKSPIVLKTECEKGRYIIKSMVDQLANWTEDELDKFCCPHPLLGKLTAREMLYFTVFHAQHHTKSVQSFGSIKLQEIHK